MEKGEQMLVYNLNLIISTILIFISRVTQENSKISKYFMLSGISIPIIISGLRFNVGTDFVEYKIWFYNYADTKSINNIGFNYLIKLIKIFTNDFQVLFIISSIIINVLIFRFIKKNTKYYELGYFLFISLYMYYSSFNIMRQWISIAIFLQALNYAFDKEFKKFLLLMIIASSFHSAALLFLPLYFLMYFKYTWKTTILLFSLTTIINLKLDTILVYLVNLFGITIFDKYLLYYDTDFATSQGGGFAYIILFVITLSGFIILRKTSKVKIKNFNQQFFLLTIGLVLSIFSVQNMIFARIQLYLLPILIVTIPNILMYLKKYSKVYIYLLVVLCGIAYMNRSLINNAGHVLPYQICSIREK